MGAILSLSFAEQALIAVLSLHILAYVYVKNKFTVRKKYKSHKSGSVLVTGASTGIGRSVAENLAGCGFRVFAGVRKDKDAKSFDDIEGIFPVMIDVNDQESVDQAVEQIESETDSLVGLVNNAGINVGAYPVEFLPLDQLKTQLDVNLIGQVRVTQAFLPLIRKAQGRIVFMSSLAGKMAGPFGGAYSASKFGIEAVADSLRRELSPWKISVSVVEPGFIETPLTKKFDDGGSKSLAKMKGTNAKHYYGTFYDNFADTKPKKRNVASTKITDKAVKHALTNAYPETRYFVASKALFAKFQPWHLFGFAVWNVVPDRFMDKLATYTSWPRTKKWGKPNES